jgi:hypothetical protein
MEYKCIKCNILFKNGGAKARHENSCNLGEHIIIEYNFGISIRKLREKYKSTYETISKFLLDNNVYIRSKQETIKIKLNNFKYIHTEETKKKLSNIKKNYFKNNPDKHPWKKNTKFKSVPCENFKTILDELNIQYLPEHTPSKERAFAMDICLPQYKIGIEVNGNQHYNKDGTLVSYYQERHDFLTNLGFEMFELHYSLFFDREKMIQLINSIINNKPLFDFDYESYLNDKLNKDYFFKKCKCGNKIKKQSSNCIKCNSIINRKIKNRPSVDVLINEVNELGYRGVGRKYNVSDSCIRKWIKSANN